MKTTTRYASMLLVLCLSLAMLACGSDEDASSGPNTESSAGETPGEANTGGGADEGAETEESNALRINELSPLRQFVEIFNGTSETVDLSTHWFCVNASYVKLDGNGVEVITGALSLAPNSYLVLDVSAADNIADKLNVAGGADIGLYERGGAFGSADAMVDYVKFGASAPAGREAVAIEAGLWAAGDTVDISEITPSTSISLIENGAGTGVSAWDVMEASLGSNN